MSVIKTTREKAWLCVNCGYMCDCATGANGDRAPIDGDASLCLNCGVPYLRKAGVWKAMTSDDFNMLSKENRKTLTLVAMMRRERVKTDLTKKDHRA